METTDIKPKRPGKRRAVVYIDHDVFRLVRIEHIERDRPVSHIVEEALARRYETMPPTGTG